LKFLKKDWKTILYIQDTNSAVILRQRYNVLKNQINY